MSTRRVTAPTRSASGARGATAPPLYFAYGSNLDADQMSERCPGSRPLGPALLRAHRLGFTLFSSRWQGGAADILPHPDGEVWGVLYELDEEGWLRLDPFESGYVRIAIEVETARERLDARSYTVREKGSAPPSRIYLEKMLRWGAHWGFPPAYLEALRAWGTSPR